MYKEMEHHGAHECNRRITKCVHCDVEGEERYVCVYVCMCVYLDLVVNAYNAIVLVYPCPFLRVCVSLYVQYVP
jgi:hypothetical protein